MRSNKSGKTGWWTKERQQYAYDRLRSEAKLSDAGAKGLISRWSKVEAPAGPTASNNITGGHRGIAQWGQKRSKGLPVNADFSVQLDHAISELNGKEKKAGDILRNAQTAEQGAIGASAYERAEGYNDRTKRDNFVGATLAGMRHVAASSEAVAAAPQGGLASFFKDPLGLQAQAAEAPAGLAAFAAPEAKQQAQIDYFGSVPTTDWSQQREEAVRQREAKPALSDPKFDARFAAQPTQAQFDARFGAAPAAPAAERFAPGLQAAMGPVSPEHYASAVPASAKARSAFDAIAAGLGAPGVSSQPEGLGSQIGAMAGPAPEAQSAPMSPDGRVADPFGNYTPGGLIGTAAASPMPAEASAFTEQPASAPTQAQRDAVATQPGAVAPGLGAPQTVKDYNSAVSPPQGLGSVAGKTASLAPGLMAGTDTWAGLESQMATGMPAATWDAGMKAFHPMGTPSQYSTEEPTIADPNAPPEEIGPQGKTIAGDFPAAPEDSMFGPISKGALLGALTGGPIGGLLGAASGMIGSGGLGSLGNAAYGPASAGEQYGIGSGLGAMQSAMGGQRGATAYSRSQPGVSVTSRGRNLGWDLTNQYGITTPSDANGNIMGNRQSLSAWGDVLGGLFDRPGKDKSKSGRGLGGLSQATHDAIGKGRGGLY